MGSRGDRCRQSVGYSQLECQCEGQMYSWEEIVHTKTAVVGWVGRLCDLLTRTT